MITLAGGYAIDRHDYVFSSLYSSVDFSSDFLAVQVSDASHILRRNSNMSGIDQNFSRFALDHYVLLRLLELFSLSSSSSKEMCEFDSILMVDDDDTTRRRAEELENQKFAEIPHSL